MGDLYELQHHDVVRLRALQLWSVRKKNQEREREEGEENGSRA